MTVTTATQTFVLFPPNKLSGGNVLINQGEHRDLYDFLNNLSYGEFKGQRMNYPWHYISSLLEAVDDEESIEINGEDVISPDRYTLTSEDKITYSSLREYLNEVSSNFGPDTIVLVSHFEG